MGARSILALAMLLGCASVTVAAPRDDGPTEIVIGHTNDLFAVTDDNDDRYTATLTLGVRHRGWEIELSENMFTDRFVNGIRFDETYLTVARGFSPGERGWVIRPEAGVARVGEGIYGQRFQNFVHRVIDHEEYFLQYVEDGDHLFLGLRVARPLAAGKRFTLTPLVELETAGFKRHALLGLGAEFDAGRKFNIVGDFGFRWTRTDLAPLDIFVEEEDPAFGIGASYGGLVDLRWTRNYFGTGSNHWHLMVRVPVTKKSGKTN